MPERNIDHFFVKAIEPGKDEICTVAATEKFRENSISDHHGLMCVVEV